MSTFRDSPSGVLVDASGGIVTSVFGRVGDVVAEVGDYDTTLVENTSTAPGSSATDALDALAGSDGHVNPSTVPGATLSDALDYLLANRSTPPAGSATDTFSGGNPGPFTAVNEDANIGDLGWAIGFPTNTSSSSGWTVSKLPAESGAMGVYRVTTATTQTAASSGPHLYLGLRGSTFDSGPLVFVDLDELRFRARWDPTPTGTSAKIAFIGLLGVTVGASVRLYLQANIAVTPNYQALCQVNPGVTVTLDTGVPVDDQFHDVTIRRVSASEIRWYIDDLLVATNTTVGSIPPDGSILTPVVCADSAITPNINGSTFVDIDTWQLVPAA